MTGLYVVRNTVTGEVVLRGATKDEAVSRRDRLNMHDAPATHPTKIVSARAARDHLHWLSENHVGWRTAARAAGIPSSTVRKIIDGKRRNCFHRTSEAILSVTLLDARPAALVPADLTWELIGCLRRAGWPKARIATALGMKRPALQINPTTVLKRTEEAVRDLHDHAWRTYPEIRLACSHGLGGE
jgi:hypothetical protein